MKGTTNHFHLRPTKIMSASLDTWTAAINQRHSKQVTAKRIPHLFHEVAGATKRLASAVLPVIVR